VDVLPPWKVLKKGSLPSLSKGAAANAIGTGKTQAIAIVGKIRYRCPRELA
jgi:hypothetical protein